MTYNKYLLPIMLRVMGLLFFLTILAFGITYQNSYSIICGAFLSLILSINLYRFVIKRFAEMDDFFQSIKYRDFSRFYIENKGPQDIRQLHQGFNLVNKTIKSIDRERHAQFLYLQKILEMVNIGIIAYNVEIGNLLWANDSLLKILDLPTFKNISFVQKRRPKVYAELFETFHTNTTAAILELGEEKLKVLISDTIFEIADKSFKLIVIQNIEETLNRNESEAWKKLLSVMTHEIMNSIAPISSLAETLQIELEKSIHNPTSVKLELKDLNAGLTSIKKRSEGLMKFAKTYRSLNKVTHINKNTVKARDLFKSISELMKSSMERRNIELLFDLKDNNLEMDIDSYLIEQVLINIILNAMDATSKVLNPKVIISTNVDSKGKVEIRVTDNGCGISPDIMDRIFIPFFSTKKTGSGIGLSLSKQIMLLHGGKIQIQSNVGTGTMVILIF